MPQPVPLSIDLESFGRCDGDLEGSDELTGQSVDHDLMPQNIGLDGGAVPERVRRRKIGVV
jgi:hypothetical protein